VSNPQEANVNSRAKTLALASAAVLIAGTGAVVAGGPSTASSSSGAAHAKHHGWPASSARPAAAIVHAAKAAAARQGTQVLTVLEIEERSASVDVGDSGESPGDYFLFGSRLMTPDGSTQVGRDSGRCTLGIRSFICDATASIFHNGKIAVYGALFAEADAKLPVIGGTGRYRDAGGTLTIKNLPSGNTLLTFEIAN
jgi:hypothetical protein